MTISVIIPAYNQGHYLRQAVQSVLDQTYQDFDVVVVDDGSTDDTAEIARSINDPRVCCISQPNAGLSAARNTGLHYSTGELVSFLDSDDLFTPDKLALLSAALDADPELGLAAGQAKLIDENGLPLGITFDKPLPEDPARLLLWNPLHVGAVLLRREWIERAGPFDESLRAYEDWDMWLRLARLGCKMGWVDQPVSLYRFHTRQMTQDRYRMTDATFAVLKKTYDDPALSVDWIELKDQAYSNAYLRAAIQAYRTGDLAAGEADLGRAVELDPELAANGGRLMEKRLSAFTVSPKISDPLALLQVIYWHLPPNLDGLRRRSRGALGDFAAAAGFAAHARGESHTARGYLLRAINYRPGLLLNRGVLSILFRNHPKERSE